MPYLDRFKHDIFLSHGWSNNLDEGDGDRGWIRDFKRKLERELVERLRGPVSIFLDVETPRNGKTERLFREHVRRSAILLAVVTPAFCSKESFCRKELNWFYKESRRISGHLISMDTRLFKVVRRPVCEQDEPEEVRGTSPYNFLKETLGPKN